MRDCEPTPFQPKLKLLTVAIASALATTVSSPVVAEENETRITRPRYWKKLL